MRPASGPVAKALEALGTRRLLNWCHSVKPLKPESERETLILKEAGNDITSVLIMLISVGGPLFRDKCESVYQCLFFLFLRLEVTTQKISVKRFN